MPKDYETDLKSTREKALAAADDILSTITYYQKSAPKQHLQFSFMVLRNICLAMQSSRGVHYDIYSDIFQRILTPLLQPTSSTHHWSKFLELVRYFHNTLLEKNLGKEGSIAFDYIRGQANKMQSEGDYKFILPIYFQHILFQRNYENVDAQTAKAEIATSLQAITDSLKEMLALNLKLNFQYPEIVTEFVQWLMPRRKAANITFINTLPFKYTQHMFEAFFDLLASSKTPLKPILKVEDECRQHLDAFFLFVQLDVDAKLQQQRNTESELALRHLKVCRELKQLQQDQAIAYVLPLMYYYVKFVYSSTKSGNFCNNYVSLCEKFTKFFADNGEMLTQKKWFLDALMMLILLIAQVHQNSSTAFKVFWQQMRTAKCYLAHMELLMSCIKLSPRITAESKLLTYNCCQSVRKHFVLEVSNIAFVAYGAMIQTKLDENGKADEDAVHKCFTQIAQHTINVLDTMSCINAESKDLKIFYARYAQLTRDIKTSKQLRYSLTIAKSLAKLETKFNRRDWSLMLRRIYKSADSLLGDRQYELELQSYYISSIVCEADGYLLYNQLTLFYANRQCVEHGKCLSDLWHGSSSPLKPHLTDEQRRHLYHTEMLSFLRYPNYANKPIHASLLRMAPTDYAYVLTAHLGELSDETRKKLETICQRLQNNAKRSEPLSRMEHLVMGHACTVRLHDQVEKRKQSLNFEWKECVEEKISELMQLQEMKIVNVSQEWYFVLTARQVVDSFREFFDKADEEYISSDEAYIEWETLLDDLTSTAQFLDISGYLNYATEAWLLVYRIANTIDDQINAARALTFFCEHAEFIEAEQYPLDLPTEIECQLNKLLGTVEELQRFMKRHQTYVLTFMCQVAYYYYRSDNTSIAHALLVFVEMKRDELPERVGKYDLILGTLDAVKFRIYCRQMAKMDKKLKVNILHHIERTMDRFRNFSYISSSDSMPYVILLHTLVLEFAEFTANRLCDGIMSGFMTCVLRVVLQMGLALRVVQTLSSWAFLNLQMERIDRAQTKLKIIDMVMGMKSDALPKGNLSKTAASALNFEAKPCRQPISAVEAMPTVELVRKMAPLDQSTEPWEKHMVLSPSLNRPLNAYLSYKNVKISEPEWLEWTYFTIGCVTGRLHFLLNDNVQLEDFYSNSQKWLQDRTDSAMVSYKYEKIKFLNLQHYINYLRSVGKYEKALKFLQNTLQDMSKTNAHLRVDSFYYLNFKLLQRVTTLEVLKKGLGRTRRVLNFNSSPVAPMATIIIEPTSKGPQLSAKKIPLIAKQSKAIMPFTIYNSPGTQAKAENFMSARKKATRCQFLSDTLDSPTSDDLNVCQAIDFMDLSDSSEEVSRTPPTPNSEVKKATEKPPKTKQKPKSTATTSKKPKVSSSRRDKQTEDDVVDLSNSFDDKLIESKKSSKTKGSDNINFIENQLFENFESLNIRSASTVKAMRVITVPQASIDTVNSRPKQISETPPKKIGPTSHATTLPKTQQKAKTAVSSKSTEDDVVDLSNSLEDKLIEGKTKRLDNIDSMENRFLENFKTLNIKSASAVKSKRAVTKPQASVDIFSDDGGGVVDLKGKRGTSSGNKVSNAATPISGGGVTSVINSELSVARPRGRTRKAVAAAFRNDENNDPATKTTNNARRRLRQL